MIRELHYDTIFDAQRHFRVLLDAMSRPGKISKLNDTDIHPPIGLNKASALIGFALLNADVKFWVDPALNEIIEYIKLNTASDWAVSSEADFIFGSKTNDLTAVFEAKTGSLLYPEAAATVIFQIHLLGENKFPESMDISLKGPGVKEKNTFFASGLSEQLLEMVQLKNIEFPLGIDLILVDHYNQFVCIPRSNTIQFQKS